MMERAAEALNNKFDVLIIGGGIHGAALCRTLARNNIRVALIDRSDFGGATTANSLKIIHGGLRYLQHLDFPRVRGSAKAQSCWFRSAPHLIRPLAFSAPTSGWATRSPIAFAIGFILYRAVTGRLGEKLPKPRLSTLEQPGYDGASQRFKGRRRFGTWFDGQILDSGRLITGCIDDAAQAGALTVNHAEAVRLLISGNRVDGALVRDRISGRDYEVKAKITIGALGPWGREFLSRSGVRDAVSEHVEWTRNVNIVLRRQLASDRAFGLTGRKASMYFLTPWQDLSILGTAHEFFDMRQSNADEVTVSLPEVESILADVSNSLHGPELTLDDVSFLHWGLTPSRQRGRARAHRTLVADHATRFNLEGFIEIVPNKLTTAPVVATDVARRVLGKLGKESFFDFSTPLCSAPREDTFRSVHYSQDRMLDWAKQIYGANGEMVAAYAARERDAEHEKSRLFRARVRFGVEREQAVRLGDAIFRCSDLAEKGLLDSEELSWCVRFMADKLGWDHERTASEISDVVTRLKLQMSGGPGRWSNPGAIGEYGTSLRYDGKG